MIWTLHHRDQFQFESQHSLQAAAGKILHRGSVALVWVFTLTEAELMEIKESYHTKCNWWGELPTEDSD